MYQLVVLGMLPATCGCPNLGFRCRAVEIKRTSCGVNKTFKRRKYALKFTSYAYQRGYLVPTGRMRRLLTWKHAWEAVETVKADVKGDFYPRETRIQPYTARAAAAAATPPGMAAV